MKTKTYLLCLLLLFFSSCSRLDQPKPHLIKVSLTDQNGFSQTISTKERLKELERVNFLHAQSYKKVLRIYERNSEGALPAVLTTYYPNGQINQYLEIVNNRAFGSYKEWYSSGKLHIKATLTGGVADTTPSAQNTWIFEGLCEVFSENEKIIAKIPYEKGVLSGKALQFYPSGALQEEVFYEGGKIQGQKKTYYENGSLHKDSNYKEGLLHGKSTEFFSSGSIFSVEIYDENKLVDSTYYDESGAPLEAIKQGFGKKVFLSKKGEREYISYYEGVPSGLVEVYTKEGYLKRSYHIKNGKKHGEDIEYYCGPSFQVSRPKLKVFWVDGQIHGTIQTWYPSGQIESQKEISQNQKQGLSICWYGDGSLMLVEEYDKGLLLKGAYYDKVQSNPTSEVKDGKGVVSLYDSEGKFLTKTFYEGGLPVS